MGGLKVEGPSCESSLFIREDPILKQQNHLGASDGSVGGLRRRFAY